MQRILDFLRTDDLPRRTRPNFVHESRYFMLWTVVIGAIEGNLAAIVVKKTFGGSNLLTSIVWAAPIVMMSLNVFWGVVIRHRRRLPLLVVLTSCAVALIGSVALTSPQWKPWGGWLFALQIALAHLFVTGLVTLQASMWQANYPASHRGRIIGRLQTIRFLVVPLSGAAIAKLFDWDAGYYRFVYPAVAAVGLLALVPLRRFRVRGERRAARRLRALVPQHPENGLPRLWQGLKEAGCILRDDVAYRRYMIAQCTLGAANFFTDPVLVAVLTGQLLFGYLASNLIMQVIPGVVALLSIRLWTGYFDRVGVLRFRVVNSMIWVASYACVAAAMLIIGTKGAAIDGLAITVLVIARILNGTANGSGMVAWSIGHLHFAREHQVDLYMSIHVALTGLRALVMPVLGSLANQWLGNGSFGIAIVISAAAFVLYRRLARRDHGTSPLDAAETHGRELTATGAHVT